MHKTLTYIIRNNSLAAEVWSVEEQTHQHTGEGTGDRDGHDPRNHQQGDSVPVDGLKRSVGKTDTDRGTRNAHRGRNRELVLGEDEDGERGAHLHRASSRGRVVGDLVAHD